MDLKQLRYFVSVLEAGGFSHAATVLGVTQPLLSRQIKLLEERIGSELFYRNGRGVELTEAGKILKDSAIRILNEVKGAQDQIGAMKEMPSGQYTIGVPPTVSAVLAVSLMRAVEAELPNVSFKIVDALSGHILEWLANGRLDLAVLYDAPIMTTLSVDPLLQEELVCVRPPNTSDDDAPTIISGKDLVTTPLVIPGKPHALRLLLDRGLSDAGLPPANIKYEIDTLATILRFVEDGMACTVLPYASVARLERLNRVSVALIREPKLSRRLVVATSNQRPVTKTTRRLVTIVKTQVNELVASNVWQPKGASDD